MVFRTCGGSDVCYSLIRFDAHRQGILALLCQIPDEGTVSSLIEMLQMGGGSPALQVDILNALSLMLTNPQASVKRFWTQIFGVECVFSVLVRMASTFSSPSNSSSLENPVEAVSWELLRAVAVITLNNLINPNKPYQSESHTCQDNSDNPNSPTED